jgi:ribosomal protein L23
MRVLRVAPTALRPSRRAALEAVFGVDVDVVDVRPAGAAVVCEQAQRLAVAAVVVDAAPGVDPGVVARRCGVAVWRPVFLPGRDNHGFVVVTFDGYERAA